MSHSPALTPPAAPVWRTRQPANLWRRLTPATPAPPRRGFTLVELMVVIGIIGLLTAISVPIVMQSLAKARNAAIKAEIDMLHMAIMNYKNEYGGFPPCTNNSAAIKHVSRIFPRWDSQSPTYGMTSFPAPETALSGWLAGYATNPMNPLGRSDSSNPQGLPRQKLFDFDQSRLTVAGQYHPSGKPESPYVYIDSSQYGNIASPTPFTIGGNTYFAQQTNGKFYNPDSFQILCAGRDGVFGNSSSDDVSNFWPGTRGD